jgi:NitT/TauT family transport system ATP-binding protein
MMTTTTRAVSTAVELRGLGVTYLGASGREVLRGIDITVANSEFVSIVGPSGVGKSTLIRCIAGLQQPTSGSVAVEGEIVTGPPRTLALVSQDYGRTLMPWLRVEDNVRLPLRGRKIARAEQDDRVRAALESVNLAAAGRSYPWQLSGGMQQRVAIARALAYQPRVLLMDEPFASVDAQTRSDLEDLVLSLQRSLEIAVVLVTHDVDESVYVAHRVIVLGGEPAAVRKVVDVPLPAERDQLVTKSRPEFLECRAQVLAEIRDARTHVPPVAPAG